MTETANPRLHLTILGASGAVGQELVRQALDRGHTVTAVARNSSRLPVDDRPTLHTVVGDVHHPETLAAAFANSDVVVSALGVRKGEQSGVLVAGARAIAHAAPPRVVWLGAFGTGPSAAAAGAVTRTLLGLVLKKELPDKVAADQKILDLGGTVVHVGPLKAGPVSISRRSLDAGAVPRRLFPAGITRATVAAALLDEAEQSTSRGLRVVLSS